MKIVIISGYFNPIHVGHINYIKSASALGNKLITIINNDIQAKKRCVQNNMKEQDRMKVVSALKHIDDVILSIDTDESVTETLKKVVKKYSFCDRNRFIFANGGDMPYGAPEEEYCKNHYLIDTAYNVGDCKNAATDEFASFKQRMNLGWDIPSFPGAEIFESDT